MIRAKNWEMFTKSADQEVETHIISHRLLMSFSAGSLNAIALIGHQFYPSHSQGRNRDHAEKSNLGIPQLI